MKPFCGLDIAVWKTDFSDGILEIEMIGRILRIFFLFALIGLIVHRLFSRSQKRAISEVVHISAWVLLAAAMLALGWYVWAAW